MFGKRSDESRTAEDRARAAAERAARRAGKPLPPEAFQDTVPPPDADQFTRPEPVPEPEPEPLPDHTVEYTPVFEEPADAEPTVRRIPREPTEEPAGAVTAPPLERPAPARRTPPPPSGPRRSSAGYWGRRVFGVIALLVILAALYVINATFQPFHGEGTGSVTVVIPDGADAGDIGKL